MHKELAKRVGRESMKTNIATAVGHFFPDDKWLRQEVRNANGFVGEGFIGVPMPDRSG